MKVRKFMNGWIRSLEVPNVGNRTMYGLWRITCPYCLKTVNVETKFCPHCGKQVSTQ